MNRPGVSLRPEALIYLLLIVGAALLRWTRLDWPPLNDAEAQHALAAAADARSSSRAPTPSEYTAPLAASYHGLTGLVLEIAPTNDATARLVPSLAGIALVLMPLLLRGTLGAAPALLASALLAVSPVLVTASRTAGGTALSLAGAALAVSILMAGSAEKSATARLVAAAGVGLMISSGPSAAGGILGMAIAVGAARLIWRDLRLPAWGPPGYRKASLFLVGALAAAAGSSGFGLVPGGLAGISESLTAWLNGWATAGPVHALTLLFALPIYEPLLLVFGIAGAVISLRARETWGRLASAWFLGALAMALIYPSRQVSDLAWAVFPLAFLAARAIAALIEAVGRHWTWQGHGALTFVLLLLGGMSLSQVEAYASGIGPGIRSGEPNLSLALAAVALLLGLVIIVLFGLGWSWPTAWEGTGLASLAMLLVFDLSAVWSLNLRVTAAGANELWRPQATPRSLAAVVETVERLSQSRNGRTDSLPIEILTEPTPALAWALREFPQAPSGEGDEPPEIVLAREGTDLTELRADYVGQRVVIGEVWGWDGVLPPDPVTWWAHHEGPAVLDPWLLLVRVDVATLGGLTELPEEAP
jgi:hypothetical protein